LSHAISFSFSSIIPSILPPSAKGGEAVKVRGLAQAAARQRGRLSWQL
jgi:hypothetical protein